MERYVIEKLSKKFQEAKIFFAESLYVKYPKKAVQRVLLQLRRNNEIVSLYRGIYVRPEKSRFLPGHGILPSSDKIKK